VVSCQSSVVESCKIDGLPIYRRHLLSPLLALFLDDDFIPYVYKAKNISVTFSYDHVSIICRKVYRALVVLWRLVVAFRFAFEILPLTVIVYTLHFTLIH
jgi:hypothetical protein